MSRLTFGGEKKSRFPYWVLPTVIFVFGVGMLAGRAMESHLTLAEFREQKLTFSDLLERLWPKNKSESGESLPARTVVEQTEAENRLKSENSRLLTEKDTLVEQVQTLRREVGARDESIKELRGEINKLAKSNQQFLDLRKENEKLEREVAQEHEARQKQTTRLAAAPAKARTRNEVAARKTTRSAAAQPNPEFTSVTSGPSYQVLRRTPLLRNPTDNAQILYYLNPGLRLHVGGIVNGKFMRVKYSPHENPPGYVLVTDVRPLQ